MLFRLNLKEKYPYAPSGLRYGGDDFGLPKVLARDAIIQSLRYDSASDVFSIFYRSDDGRTATVNRTRVSHLATKSSPESSPSGP